MIDWRPHRLWIGLLALALTIGASHATILALAQSKAEKKLSSLKLDYQKTSRALQQLEEDIAEAERMRTEMDLSDAEKFLAPSDRLRTAQLLERMAAESRLTRFNYALSPEQKTTIETLTGSMQEFATSKWNLSADAPTDVDAFVFLDEMAAQIQGSVTIREVSLDRLGSKDSPIASANVRLMANGDWLSNGAVKNPARERP